MSFICVRITNHFHINAFTLSLALKQRLLVTWRWPTRFGAPFSHLNVRMDLVGTSTEVERARKPTIQRQAV